MKKSFKILIIIFIVILAGCNDKKINTSENIQQNKIQSSSGISIIVNNIDLGEIPIRGGSIDIVFLFRNNGKEAVLITEGETSCMCTVAVIEKSNMKFSPQIKMRGHGIMPVLSETVTPGEELKLIATFDPLAHGINAIGPIKRDVILKTNSTKTPVLKFSFLGTVVK